MDENVKFDDRCPAGGRVFQAAAVASCLVIAPVLRAIDQAVVHLKKRKARAAKRNG